MIFLYHQGKLFQFGLSVFKIWPKMAKSRGNLAFAIVTFIWSAWLEPCIHIFNMSNDIFISPKWTFSIWAFSFQNLAKKGQKQRESCLSDRNIHLRSLLRSFGSCNTPILVLITLQNIKKKKKTFSLFVLTRAPKGCLGPWEHENFKNWKNITFS